MEIQDSVRWTRNASQKIKKILSLETVQYGTHQTLTIHSGAQNQEHISRLKVQTILEILETFFAKVEDHGHQDHYYYHQHSMILEKQTIILNSSADPEKI